MFGAGVNGCNGLLSPTEYSGNGQVVLYMGEQGAIIFREQEGWRMNSEFNISTFDYYTVGVEPTGTWAAAHPSQGSAPLAQRM